MFLTRLAFKNLFRNKLRTTVSLVAIAFAVLVVVFTRGFIVGMVDSLFRDHIQYNSGHVKIVDQKYHQQQRTMTLEYPVDGYQKQDLDSMITDLQQIEGVEQVVPRLKFGAMFSAQKELITMSGWGINPAEELEFTNIEDQLAAGRMVQPGQMEVVMGTGLLEKLDHQVGERITILYSTAFGSLKGATFKIVGRLESGLKMLNDSVFYLPLDQAQRLLYMDRQVTELLLIASERRKASNLQPRVESLLAEKGADKYVALNYKETSDLLAYFELAKLIYNQMYIFLVLLASIVVINTMIMVVNERTKEIGMMSALGMKQKEIQKLFIIEGGIMGALGSLIGAVLGFFLTGYLAKQGLNFSAAVSGINSEVMFNSIVYPVSSLSNAAFAFVLGIIIVALSCIIPARRAAKLEPTEAITN